MNILIGTFLAVVAGIAMLVTVMVTGGMDAEGVIATPTVVGVAIACALLVGAYVAIFLPLFFGGRKMAGSQMPDFRELNRLTEELKKDREVKVRARGVITLSLLLLFLSTLVIFAGCKGGGGPTSPSGECSGLQGGNPVGRWSDRKTPPFVLEYKSDGAYIQNGRPRGTYRVEGNRLIYNGLRPEETFNYFAVTGGDILTLCYSGTFTYYRE